MWHSKLTFFYKIVNGLLPEHLWSYLKIVNGLLPEYLYSYLKFPSQESYPLISA